MRIAIWDGLIQGDKEAFILLYKGYFKYLCAYGYRFTPNKELVEETVQQLFFEFWDKRHSLKPVRYPKAYLQTCLRRKLLKELALSQSHVNISDLDHTEKMDQEPGYEDILVDREKDQQKRLRLQQAMQQLSETQKELLRLRFFENMSYAEISEFTSINQDQAYNHISRALKKLRKILLLGAVAMVFLFCLRYTQ